MANPNFSAPAISNKIASDIDSIRELAKLIARLRGDLADNAPDGTIIFNQTAMNFQMKNGTVWSALDDGTGKYAFNVDRLDGFHANAGIIANSIVVRDSKGVIPGNISGRAPNATQADELTTVNPIAKGGTGAATAAQARANLGTNDIGNLTAGVLPFERGGTGRTDGSAQDVQISSEVVNANNSTAKGRGQIGGLAMGRGLGTDANLFTGNGRYWFNNSDALVNFPKNNIGGSLTVRAYAMYSHQEYINYNNTGRFWRITQNTGSTWTPWYRVPEGLTDDYTTNSSVVAASAKAVKTAYDLANAASAEAVKAVYDRLEALRVSFLGVPRYWRSTTLPAGYVWANGDLALFSDWPELENLYRSGGLEGMLLSYDVPPSTIAQHCGRWRLNASSPTGLYVPNLSERFINSTINIAAFGTANTAGVPNITGEWEDLHVPIVEVPALGQRGAIVANGVSYAISSLAAGGTGYVWDSINFDASRSSAVYGRSPTVMPASVNYPIIIYLGNHS